MAVKLENAQKRYMGLAADVKPTPAAEDVGASYYATDTGARWIWDGANWQAYSSTAYTGHVLPIANNTYDIGAALLTYRNGYFGTCIYVVSAEVTGDFSWTDGYGIVMGTGDDCRLVYDATDANANMLKLNLPTGGAVNVPVLGIGVGIIGQDLAVLNGVTEPTIAIWKADRTAYSTFSNSGIKVNGSIFINDTSNANMTMGLTINQGAAADSILSLKSSDVAHGATVYAETDTYMYIRKQIQDGGGIFLCALSDSGHTANNPTLYLNALSGIAADTTRSTSGRAPFEFRSALISGTGIEGNYTTNGNVLAVGHRHAGANVTDFIVGTDGCWLAGNLTQRGHTAFGATGLVSTKSLIDINETTSLDNTGDYVGIYHQPIWGKTTAGAFTGTLRGALINAYISAANTQNWTTAQSIAAMSATVVVNSGATGTILDVISVKAGAVFGAMTITNRYGLYVSNVTGGGTVTNQYGIYVEAMTKGATLNYGLYIAGGLSYFGGGITLADAIDFTFNTTTGTKIGTGATQKIGFWNATPAVQPAHIADADAGTIVTQFNALLLALEGVGMLAAA